MINKKTKSIPILQITNLHAGYEDLEILKDITLHVNEKEIIALIGPNGAGKSTLIKSIFALTTITQGSITYKETDLRRLKTHELIKLGICYINQGRVIFNMLTVLENLLISTENITKESINTKLSEVYHLFPQLKKDENTRADILSGGQRQMLALARALMQSPSLLLLDEPSLGLSPKLQKDLFNTIKKLRDKNISILIVEQNAKKAIEIADRTYLLEDGRIVLESPSRSILKHKKLKQVYLGGRY